MKPGRELDALVAEKILGHKVFKNVKGGWSLGRADYYDSYGESILFNPLPAYSEDIAAAWTVMEKLVDLVGRVDMTHNGGKWLVTIEGRVGFMVDGQETAAHAICTAALKAIK